MPLTLDQAKQAGILAGHIAQANEAIASFDKRIEAAMPVISISARQADDTQIREDIPLTAEEMVGLYNYLKDIVTAKRDALQADLDKISIE